MELKGRITKAELGKRNRKDDGSEYTAFELRIQIGTYERNVADILVHVVDISAADFEEQMQIVEQTLRDIGAANKPVYVVFNKVDAYTWEEYDEFSLDVQQLHQCRFCQFSSLCHH